MHKKIAEKIDIGLIASWIALLVFFPAAIYLIFQERSTWINSKVFTYEPSDPFTLIGMINGVMIYWIISLTLSLIFWILYATIEYLCEKFTKKMLTKHNRIYLFLVYIFLLLFSASQIYLFVIHETKNSSLREGKTIELTIKKNTLNLSKNQSNEIYSIKLKKYWLPGSSKNLIYESRGVLNKKTFLWDKDEFSIFFRNFREIVIENLTQNTTIDYSINKYYKNIKSIAFDIFELPWSEDEYLFIRADLWWKPYRSLFLAFNKNWELLYEELVNGLDN